MKKQLFSLALTLGTFFTISPVLAQVDYTKHSFIPNPYYGSSTTFVGRIRLVTDYVNGRQSPSTNSKVIASFFSHQPVQVERVYRSRSGDIWYLVYEPTRSQYGWVRGDMLN